MTRQKRTPVLVRLGMGFAAWTLLALTASAGHAVAARERDSVTSELEARWPTYTGERFNQNQMIVKSLRSHEDRLYVNDEPFVVTHQTLIVDERGRRLRPGCIWVGWLVEVQYRTGERSEGRGYGPDEKVLVRMRVLKRLKAPAAADK
jgi:hypothetical protein